MVYDIVYARLNRGQAMWRVTSETFHYVPDALLDCVQLHLEALDDGVGVAELGRVVGQQRGEVPRHLLPLRHARYQLLSKEEEMRGNLCDAHVLLRISSAKHIGGAIISFCDYVFIGYTRCRLC